MTHARPRLLAAAAVGVLLLSPLAACGGDEEPSGASSLQQPSSAATSALDASAFVDRALAAIDAKNTVHMEIAGGSFLTATADMAYGGETASRITASVFGGQQVIVVKDDVVYLQASPGAKFTVVDEKTPTLGPLISTFTSLGPRESVAGIQPAITSVEGNGTTYTVTVDTSKLSGALKLLAGTSNAAEKLAMTFSLDGDGLVEKIEFPISGEPVTITFSDWDKPVTVEKPTDVG